jgi:hypothetical protein
MDKLMDRQAFAARQNWCIRGLGNWY